MESGGKTLQVVATIGLCLCILAALVMDLMVVHRAGGALAFIIALVLAPVTILAVPWYAALAAGNWWPVILTYVGGGLFALLRVLGLRMSGRAA